MAVEFRASVMRTRRKAGVALRHPRAPPAFAVVLGTAVGQVQLPFFETFLVIASELFGVEAELPADHRRHRLVGPPAAGARGGTGRLRARRERHGDAGALSAIPSLRRASPASLRGRRSAPPWRSSSRRIPSIPGWFRSPPSPAPSSRSPSSTPSRPAGAGLDVSTLLLAGLAVGAFFSAIISALYTLSTTGCCGRSSTGSWGTSPECVGPRGSDDPLYPAGERGPDRFPRDLNAFALGEEEARTMGVDVEAVKRWVLLLVALVTGASISVSGMIGFVGLIVPHTMRFVVGPDHKWLLPASALGGASFMILCDLLSRTLFSPIELRPGIVTSLFGVPFFVLLLLKHRQRVGWS